MSTTKDLQKMAKDAIEHKTSMALVSIDHTDRKNQIINVTCLSTFGSKLALKVKFFSQKVSIESEVGIIYFGRL